MGSNKSEGLLFKHIREYIQKLKMEFNAEYQVVFYTSLGRMVCDLEEPAQENSLVSFTDDPTNFTIDISAMFAGKGILDTQWTYVKNIIVYKNDSDKVLFKEEQMILFDDQLLGFTLVKK